MSQNKPKQTKKKCALVESPYSFFFFKMVSDV